MTEQITEEKTIENMAMELIAKDCEVFTDEVFVKSIPRVYWAGKNGEIFFNGAPKIPVNK